MTLLSFPDRNDLCIAAHRGVSGRCPENTRAAFDLAVATGADAIECDLQLSADDRIVVCHDDSLARFGHAEIEISKTTLQQLRDVDVGSWFAPEFHDQRLMTLDELLAGFGSRLPQLLELKPKTLSPDRVSTMLRRVTDIVTHHRARETVQFLCFDVNVLEQLFRQAPWVVPVFNTHHPQRLDEAFLTQRPWIAAIDGNIRRLTKNCVQLIHQHGRRALCFTCDSADDVTKARDIGVDAVIANDPELMRQALRDHRLPVAAMPVSQGPPLDLPAP